MKKYDDNLPFGRKTEEDLHDAENAAARDDMSFRRKSRKFPIARRKS